MSTLAQRIRDRRQELGMNQKEMARWLGLTQGNVAQLELGMRSPSLEVLTRLANVLTVSADYLLMGEAQETVDVSRLPAADRRMVRRFAEFLAWEGTKRPLARPEKTKPKKGAGER